MVTETRTYRTPPAAAQAKNGGAASTMSAVTNPIESVIRRLDIEKVYGAPVSVGETTVVPVAEMRAGFGFGSGYGKSKTSQQEEGGGGGGGAGVRMIPRGYIRIAPEGISYQPIFDVKDVMLAGALFGWLLYKVFTRR